MSNYMQLLCITFSSAARNSVILFLNLDSHF